MVYGSFSYNDTILSFMIFRMSCVSFIFFEIFALLVVQDIPRLEWLLLMRFKLPFKKSYVALEEGFLFSFFVAKRGIRNSLKEKKSQPTTAV